MHKDLQKQLNVVHIPERLVILPFWYMNYSVIRICNYNSCEYLGLLRDVHILNRIEIQTIYPCVHSDLISDVDLQGVKFEISHYYYDVFEDLTALNQYDA